MYRHSSGKSVSQLETKLICALIVLAILGFFIYNLIGWVTCAVRTELEAVASETDVDTDSLGLTWHYIDYSFVWEGAPRVITVRQLLPIEGSVLIYVDKTGTKVSTAGKFDKSYIPGWCIMFVIAIIFGVVLFV